MIWSQLGHVWQGKARLGKGRVSKLISSYRVVQELSWREFTWASGMYVSRTKSSRLPFVFACRGRDWRDALGRGVLLACGSARLPSCPPSFAFSWDYRVSPKNTNSTVGCRQTTSGKYWFASIYSNLPTLRAVTYIKSVNNTQLLQGKFVWMLPNWCLKARGKQASVKPEDGGSCLNSSGVTNW